MILQPANAPARAAAVSAQMLWRRRAGRPGGKCRFAMVTCKLLAVLRVITSEWAEV
jgi:hypothetical protein